jgi:peptidoglycan/xylan/chitin deacetylase (PgdA/CDA1 family)
MLAFRAFMAIAGLVVTLVAPVVPATAETAVNLTSPPGLSPNRDGRFDVAMISMETSGPADVSVWIEAGDGARIRTLAEAQPVDGAVVYTWRGRDDAGKRVDDGRYLVVATTWGPGGEERQREPIVLDSKPPSFSWREITPEPLRSDRAVRFSFMTDDRFWDRVSISFTIRDADGRLVERIRVGRGPTGYRTVSWDAHAPGWRAVPPGLYRAQVKVRDRLGNVRTGRSRPFRDHQPVPSRTIRRVEGAGRRVALTFDDCGYGSAWKQILGALHTFHAEATFFCTGRMVRGHASLARRTVELGNAVGSHTWNHRSLIGVSEATVRAEVRRDQGVWWRRARATPAPFFRPPGASIGATTLAGVGSQGFAWTVLWDVDPRDWSGISAAEIQRRVLSSARSGSIVVMHVKAQTALAVRGILRGLRGRGLEPVTLSALLRADA